MFTLKNFNFLLLTAQISFTLASSSFQNYTKLHNDNFECSDNSFVSFRSSFFLEKSEKAIKNYIKEFTSRSVLGFSQLKENSQCKKHVDIIGEEAGKLQIWALKMLDATAKLPSGVLNGNLNQFGDFDECLTSKGQSGKEIIQGKYCLANVKIKILHNQINDRIQLLDDAVHSNRLLKSGLKDQGHRIPKFETFNWGICVPASCSQEEIEMALNEHLQQIFDNHFLKIKVSIEDDVCYVRTNKNYSVTEIGVKFLFLVLIVLLGYGTLIDTKKWSINESKLNKALKCFSLKKNWSKLMETNTSKDEIKCLHGARFLNAIALLLSHKQIAMLFNPLINRTEMSETFGKAWTMIGRSAILYTDSFILISGLLASYTLVKELDNKKGNNFKNKLINRMIRFTPNLVFTILFCTYIMDSMASGPQWGLVVHKYTKLCKNHMWRNFLYIHNHFGFENMCLTHTHQLGIDMQLFLVSFVFIHLIWKSPVLGSLLIFVVSIASTWLRYKVTYQEELSTNLYYGISVKRLWKTANLSYILPTHRLTVYLIGIFLGYFFRRKGKNLNFSYFQSLIGWFLAILAALLAVFGPYDTAYKRYVYNPVKAANFNAYAPVLWSAFVSWAIIASVNNCGGVFNDFLCWKYFTVFTKISYSLYLTQFPVFFYNVGTQRSVQHYKGIYSLFDFSEYAVIFIASVALTLFVDLPFQELKKVFLTSCSQKTPAELYKKGDPDINFKDCQEKTRTRKKLQFLGT